MYISFKKPVILFGFSYQSFPKKTIEINSSTQRIILFSYGIFQGFFKDMLTVNNPSISPQRIEQYVNAAVSTSNSFSTK